MIKSVIALLICLEVGCFAQKLPNCKAPPLLTGHIDVVFPEMKLMANARYIYDEFDQRIRIKEIGTSENITFHFDGLLSYNEHVIYLINEQNRTCTKVPLKGNFKPIGVPDDATLVGATVLGTSSAPLEGLDVNSWIGETEEKGKYMMTLTMFGCIPVSTLYHTDKSGWVITSFYNNVVGVDHMEDLYPPPFCQGVKLREESSDFYSLFLNH